MDQEVQAHLEAMLGENFAELGVVEESPSVSGIGRYVEEVSSDEDTIAGETADLGSDFSLDEEMLLGSVVSLDSDDSFEFV